MLRQYLSHVLAAVAVLTLALALMDCGHGHGGRGFGAGGGWRGGGSGGGAWHSSSGGSSGGAWHSSGPWHSGGGGGGNAWHAGGGGSGSGWHPGGGGGGGSGGWHGGGGSSSGHASIVVGGLASAPHGTAGVRVGPEGAPSEHPRFDHASGQHDRGAFLARLGYVLEGGVEALLATVDALPVGEVVVPEEVLEEAPPVEAQAPPPARPTVRLRLQVDDYGTVDLCVAVYEQARFDGVDGDVAGIPPVATVRLHATMAGNGRHATFSLDGVGTPGCAQSPATSHGPFALQPPLSTPRRGGYPAWRM